MAENDPIQVRVNKVLLLRKACSLFMIAATINASEGRIGFKTVELKKFSHLVCKEVDVSYWILIAEESLKLLPQHFFNFTRALFFQEIQLKECL